MDTTTVPPQYFILLPEICAVLEAGEGFPQRDFICKVPRTEKTVYENHGSFVCLGLVCSLVACTVLATVLRIFAEWAFNPFPLGVRA